MTWNEMAWMNEKKERKKERKKEGQLERKKESKKERKKEWMNGWMNEWMNGWMSEWMNEWMNEGRKEGRNDEWNTHVFVDGWASYLFVQFFSLSPVQHSILHMIYIWSTYVLPIQTDIVYIILKIKNPSCLLNGTVSNWQSDKV